MKTTIEIQDALFEEARAAAARSGRTLRSLVEEGLRLVLRQRPKREKFKLRKASFRGRGLHEDALGKDWAEIRERAYEGRGT